MIAYIPFVGEALVEIPDDTEDNPEAIYQAALDAWEKSHPPYGPELGDLEEVEWSFLPRILQGNVIGFDTTNEAVMGDA